jgi:hypothetical protein
MFCTYAFFEKRPPKEAELMIIGAAGVARAQKHYKGFLLRF